MLLHYSTWSVKMGVAMLRTFFICSLTALLAMQAVLSSKSELSSSTLLYFQIFFVFCAILLFCYWLNYLRLHISALSHLDKRNGRIQMALCCTLGTVSAAKIIRLVSSHPAWSLLWGLCMLCALIAVIYAGYLLLSNFFVALARKKGAES